MGVKSQGINLTKMKFGKFLSNLFIGTYVLDSYTVHPSLLYIYLASLKLSKDLKWMYRKMYNRTIISFWK